MGDVETGKWPPQFHSLQLSECGKLKLGDVQTGKFHPPVSLPLTFRVEVEV